MINDKRAEAKVVGAVSTFPSLAFVQLNKLRDLEYDWDGYGSPPPNAWAFARAEEAIRLFLSHQLEPSKVAPLGRGGVEIYFDCRTKLADLQCSNSGKLFNVTVDPAGRIEVDEESDVETAIQRIQAFIKR